MSTGGFSSKTFLEVSKILDSQIIHGLELSGGRHTDTLEEDLYAVSKRFKIVMHNYFPVPKEPFVFNLASFNNEIVEASMEHAKKAIELTAANNGKYYSFHAGYLLDPKASELGKVIGKKQLNDRKSGLKVFINNVNKLADYASGKGITLLIENNVISTKNFESFNCDPLLMTAAEETREIFNKVASNVKLLIDVAHLKVSSNTLGFNPVDYLKEFKEITGAYHISDNDGLEDSNQPFTEKSWFIEHIRKDLDYYSLEIYTPEIEVLESQYLLMSEVLR
ncbi:sugar phosphate isomerase/epimerase [Vibrio sp. Isolate25]|uniref:sugar phosphate isomerase/epimerase family protein n=1 Tax=Vibrio sp. Isolate25 TaxID=2908535 RepID=UPI001EFCF6EB|nr:TIM barrel protein [Vibrio sp. Isolate25]MCG9597816.1 sugar phosphate isomerase/epimerase [Vibrio sp. Isolate25]